MILKKPLPWGKITGKLSLTPEQAHRMLGFNMKPNAKGVIFYQSHGKTIVKNFLPTTPPHTKHFQIIKLIGKTLNQIAHENLNSLIRPIWNPIAPPPLAGNNFFFKVNAKRIFDPIYRNLKSNPSRHRITQKLENELLAARLRRATLTPQWKNLLISLGPLKTPNFKARYCPPFKRIIIHKFFSKNTHTAIAFFDTKYLKLYHYPPSVFPRHILSIQSPVKLHNPIVFLYIKINNLYSNSIYRTAKLCDSWNPSCNAKRRFHGKICQLALGNDPRKTW